MSVANRGAAQIRELQADETHLAHRAMSALRATYESEQEFVEHVDGVLPPPLATDSSAPSGPATSKQSRRPAFVSVTASRGERVRVLALLPRSRRRHARHIQRDCQQCVWTKIAQEVAVWM
jgi:hypothetical protein